QQLPFDGERRDLEMYFQSDLTDQAQIQFANQWTEPMYYLDNVEVTRVAVQAVDPFLGNKLLVNDQPTAQSFSPPDGCWSDINGNLINGQVSVPAFSSKAIFQLPDDACSISTGITGMHSDDQADHLHPNPVMRGEAIYFPALTNGRLLLMDMRGAIALDSSIASGASSMTIPSDIVPGIYMARVQGDERTVVQKLIVR
ncbi:MAG: T9SS type A sorting domain-containing protein, partial [Flavobacteriales bacterium]|nr:T9SS type A sorting domain-containing protein [Flavobacteriales bacterium]